MDTEQLRKLYNRYAEKSMQLGRPPRSYETWLEGVAIHALNTMDKFLGWVGNLQHERVIYARKLNTLSSEHGALKVKHRRLQMARSQTKRRHLALKRKVKGLKPSGE